jgi:glycosyltransferase involved in cell wall biosynthesis
MIIEIINQMNNNTNISIIIPVFNEINFIGKILQLVNLQKKFFNIQIIVSDDGSNDGTYEFLNINKKLYDNLIRSEKNKGKGFAIKKAMPFINGDIVIIQDADLEYNPADYKNILTPFTESGADVVYGNRFANNNYQRLHFFSHKIANIIITLIVNFVTNINFSDVECGFKAFKAEIFKSILLNEKSFGFEIEITKKISKLNLKIFQAPVSYNGRNYSEGKKIKFKDALRAIYCIFRY